MFIGKTITVRLSHGHSLESLISTHFSYGHSPIHNLPDCPSLSAFIDVHFNHQDRNYLPAPISFSITPIRSRTLNHTCILFLSLIASKRAAKCPPTILTHLSVPFWLNLFRSASTHLSRGYANRVRVYIKHYVFVSFRIPCRSLSTQLSFNFSITFHPAISASILSKLVHKLVHLSLPDKTAAQYIAPIRISSRRPADLASILFNHTRFIRSFSPNHPPTDCDCKIPPNSPPASHLLLLPRHLPPRFTPAIRNLSQPSSDKSGIAMCSIV